MQAINFTVSPKKQRYKYGVSNGVLEFRANAFATSIPRNFIDRYKYAYQIQKYSLRWAFTERNS